MPLIGLLVRFLPCQCDEFDGDANVDSDANVSTDVDAVGNVDNGGDNDKDVGGCSDGEADNGCDVKVWTNLQNQIINIYIPASQ